MDKTFAQALNMHVQKQLNKNADTIAKLLSINVDENAPLKEQMSVMVANAVRASTIISTQVILDLLEDADYVQPQNEYHLRKVILKTLSEDRQSDI